MHRLLYQIEDWPIKAFSNFHLFKMSLVIVSNHSNNNNSEHSNSTFLFQDH